MANTIETKDMEVGAWWLGKQLEKKDRSKITKELKNLPTEDEAAKEEAAKLLQKIEEGAEWTGGQIKEKEVPPTQPNQNLDPGIDQAINDLNRPEAKAGLKQSYQTIQNDFDDMNKIRVQAKSFIKKIFGFWPKKEDK